MPAEGERCGLRAGRWRQAAATRLSYLSTLDERPVCEEAGVEELRGLLDGELPQSGEDPAAVVEEASRAPPSRV